MDDSLRSMTAIVVGHRGVAMAALFRRKEVKNEPNWIRWPAFHKLRSEL